jgi:hypothetical protein
LQGGHALDGRQQGRHLVVAAQEIGRARLAVWRLIEKLEELKRMRRTIAQRKKNVTTG